ncbi:class I SAM-dependent methyltransferase [soil metagenome]
MSAGGDRLASIAEHYDTHLAEHYSWLFGGLPQRIEENLALFGELGIAPVLSKRALDFGAGTGFQSVPLARLGFSVTAIDLSRSLLAELEANAKGLPVRAVCDDVLHFVASAEGDVELAVCMGDTLTHLSTFGDVQRLFRETFRLVAPGGRFVLAFRDFTSELVGKARFIPVRADASTVFTCFLEYEGDHVRVYDVIHRRNFEAWEMKVSAYKKLRIAPDWAEKRLRETGFTVVRSEDRRGMRTILVQKP